MGWLPADAGYEVTLRDGKVMCRKDRGKALKALPKALKDDEVVLGLRQLAEWLDRHQASCHSEVERWMVRSLPVPAAVLGQVWPDPAWHGAFADLVVVPVGPDGVWSTDDVGFLRDVDRGRGLGVVNLDGESAWWRVDRVAIPHPVRLADLEDLREFAVDLGVTQGTLQLFREIWTKPDTAEDQAKELVSYAGGRFAQLVHVTSRAAKLGYQVRGGYAVCRVWEGGRTVTAAVWVGSGDPSVETATGDLAFTDADGAAVATADVGPVTWSEGMRMAAGLYAGREVKEESA